MNGKLGGLLTRKRNLVILFVFFAVGASVQSLVSGTKTYVEGGKAYNRYNNYTIFKQSHQHLKDQQDLYVLFPEEQWDLYKYTPTFSALFGIFALLPDWAGLNLWNLLNALILLMAVYYLPRLTDYEKGLALLLVSVETLTSVQSEQSNALMAGLLVLSFGLLENRKYLPATLCIVFSAFIKLFGVVGFALFLLYPSKWKLFLYTAFWTLALLVIPFLFVGPEQYLELLLSYWQLLADDHSASYGYSVMGWLHSWFGWVPDKNLVVLAGVVVFLIPLTLLKKYADDAFRYLMLCSILIWIVVFNHKAESPTFVIAMTGAALWFVRSEKQFLTILLFACALILTTLSPTDLFPRFLREEWVKPYTLKAVPCILIWLKIIYDAVVKRTDRMVAATDGQTPCIPNPKERTTGCSI